MKFTHSITRRALILYLEKRGVIWAKKIALEKWPTQIDNATTTLLAWFAMSESGERRQIKLDDTDAERMRNVIPYISFGKFSELVQYGIKSNTNDSTWLKPLIDWWDNDKQQMNRIETFVDKTSTGLKLHINPISTKQSSSEFNLIKTLSLVNPSLTPPSLKDLNFCS